MRRALLALLVPLAVVLPVVAAWTTWGHAQATDPGRHAAAARALAADATVQRAVADRLVEIADARLAATPVPGADPAVVRARVRAVADRLVASAAYRAALRATVRTTQARLATRLTGDVATPVTLDLTGLAATLRARLTAAGLAPVAAAIRDPAPVVVADAQEVRRAHRAFDAVRVARAISLPGAVLALLGVALLARRRSAGLLQAAACLGAAVLVGLVAWLVVHAALGDAVAAAVFDVLSRPLRTWAIGGMAGAAALAAAGAALQAARHRATRDERHPWPLPRP